MPWLGSPTMNSKLTSADGRSTSNARFLLHDPSLPLGSHIQCSPARASTCGKARLRRMISVSAQARKIVMLDPAHLSIVLYLKALLQHPFGPRISRKTRCNNVERWVIRRARCQERQYLHHLKEASWPCSPRTYELNNLWL
jgi:hypothetical protein